MRGTVDNWLHSQARVSNRDDARGKWASSRLRRPHKPTIALISLSIRDVIQNTGSLMAIWHKRLEMKIKGCTVKQGDATLAVGVMKVNDLLKLCKSYLQNKALSM